MTYLEQMKAHFKSNNKTKEYQYHQNKVHSVHWNADGRRLASGSFDKTVTVFTLDKDRLSKDVTLRGHGDSVDQLRWHPRHTELLATASGDKTVRLWDARSGKSTSTIATKGENINICWSPDGHTIAVGNKDDIVTFIDGRSHKIRVEEQFKFEVNEISWNHHGDMFFLTSGLGSVHALSYPDLKSQHVMTGHTANCICIEFDPVGKHFATGSADALVSIWDANELVCLRTLTRLDWPVRTLGFSHDGQLIASASEDLLIDIAEVSSGERVCEVPCESPTFTVCWHPRRHLLAFACDDKDRYDRNTDAGNIKLFGLPE